MSAAFNFANEAHWGTDGSIEAYLETLAQIAAERFGASDPMATALSRERNQFYAGYIVFLDPILTAEADRIRFAQLLEMATANLLREEFFTDIGRNWVATEIRTLRERIESAPPSVSVT